jgi:hypothetical protein
MCRSKSQYLLVQSMKTVTLLSAIIDSQLNFAYPFRCSYNFKHHTLFQDIVSITHSNTLKHEIDSTQFIPNFDQHSDIIK